MRYEMWINVETLESREVKEGTPITEWTTCSEEWELLGVRTY